MVSLQSLLPTQHYSGPSTTTLGRIEAADGSGVVHFQFNPDSIQVTQGSASAGTTSPYGVPSGGRGTGGGSSTRSRAGRPSGTSTPGGTGAPGGGTRASAGTSKTWQVSFNTIYFDAGFGGDISPDIQQLYEWMQPPSQQSSNTSPTKRQTKVKAFIGSTKWAEGYISSLTVKYTLFRPDGKPTRALVTSLGITVDASSYPMQNPTSGGLASYSTHLLGAGESLQSVAFTTYGHARLWRHLAVLNGIDDPLRVRPGTVVMLPTLSELLDIE